MTYLCKILMYSPRGAPSWPTISAKGMCVLIIKPACQHSAFSWLILISVANIAWARSWPKRTKTFSFQFLKLGTLKSPVVWSLVTEADVDKTTSDLSPSKRFVPSNEVIRISACCKKDLHFCCLNVEVSVIATDLTKSEKLTIRYGWLTTVRMGWAEDEVRVAIHGFVMYRSGYAISLRLHADIQERNREGKPSVICWRGLPVPQRLSTKHCRWLSITAYTVSSQLSRSHTMYIPWPRSK